MNTWAVSPALTALLLAHAYPQHFLANDSHPVYGLFESDSPGGWYGHLARRKMLVPPVLEES